MWHCTGTPVAAAAAADAVVGAASITEFNSYSCNGCRRDHKHQRVHKGLPSTPRHWPQTSLQSCLESLSSSWTLTTLTNYGSCKQRSSAVRCLASTRGAAKSSSKRAKSRSTKSSPHKQAPGKEDSQGRMPMQAKRRNMAMFAADERLLFTPRLASAADPIRCIYAFPNEYSVGICSLGYQLVWSMLAESEHVHVARLFTDASEALMASPHLVGFSFSWELDYSNVLHLLEELSLPLLASERGEEHPLVFGGGAVLTANPEPYADFFDLVLLGDAEDVVPSLLDAMAAMLPTDASRAEKLQALAQLPGVYVPQLYSVEYSSPTGPVVSIQPLHPSVPAEVQRAVFRGRQLAASTVVSERMAWENIFMVEVVRSCPEMCNFCMASFLTLPFRSPSVASHLIPAVERGLQFTDRVGLLGASVTQHPEFSQLLQYMLQPQLSHVRLSIASVRCNTVTQQLAAALSARGTTSLTVAIESGSERLRQVVNKKLEQDEIIAAAVNAQEGGLKSLKFYSMVGLPSETDDDISATIELLSLLRSAAPRLRLTLGCSTFVPKAQTPFQHYGVAKEASKRLQRLEKEMRKLHVEFRPESYKWSVVQALLSRGDRRLSQLLLLARQFGGSQGAIGRAMKELNGSMPSLETYAHRQIPIDEVLPWSHLGGPISRELVEKRAEEATQYFEPLQTTHC